MAIFRHTGNFDKTEGFLTRVLKLNLYRVLNDFGSRGVTALANATPKNTGKTASSWDYEIVKNSTGYKLIWTNSNIVDGIPVVILIQYGHGTGNGAYVEGQDFINPALKPILDQLANNLSEEVSKL